MKRIQMLLCVIAAILFEATAATTVPLVLGFPFAEELQCEDFFLASDALSNETNWNQVSRPPFAWRSNRLIIVPRGGTFFPSLQFNSTCTQQDPTQFSAMIAQPSGTVGIDVPQRAVIQSLSIGFKSSMYNYVRKVANKLFVFEPSVIMTSSPGQLHLLHLEATAEDIASNTTLVRFPNISRPAFMDVTSAFLYSNMIADGSMTVAAAGSCPTMGNGATATSTELSVTARDGAIDVFSIVELVLESSVVCDSLTMALTLKPHNSATIQGSIQLYVSSRVAQEDSNATYFEGVVSFDGPVIDSNLAASTDGNIVGVFGVASPFVAPLSALDDQVFTSAFLASGSVFASSINQPTVQQAISVIFPTAVPGTYVPASLATGSSKCGTSTAIPPGSLFSFCFPSQHQWSAYNSLVQLTETQTAPVSVIVGNLYAQVSKLALVSEHKMYQLMRIERQSVQCHLLRKAACYAAHESMCTYHSEANVCHYVGSPPAGICFSLTQSACSLQPALCYFDSVSRSCLPAHSLSLSCFNVSGHDVCSEAPPSPHLALLLGELFVATGLVVDGMTVYLPFYHLSNNVLLREELSSTSSQWKAVSEVDRNDFLSSIINPGGFSTTVYVEGDTSSAFGASFPPNWSRAVGTVTMHMGSPMRVQLARLSSSSIDLSLNASGVKISDPTVLVQENLGSEILAYSTYQNISGLAPQTTYRLLALSTSIDASPNILSLFDVFQDYVLTFTTPRVAISSSSADRTIADPSSVLVHIFSSLSFDSLTFPPMSDVALEQTVTVEPGELLHFVRINNVSSGAQDLPVEYQGGSHIISVPASPSAVESVFNNLRIQVGKVKSFEMDFETKCDSGSGSEQWLIFLVRKPSNSLEKVMERSVTKCDQSFSIERLRSETTYEIQAWVTQELPVACDSTIDSWDPQLMPVLPQTFCYFENSKYFYARAFAAHATVTTPEFYPQEHFTGAPTVAALSITNVSLDLILDVEEHVTVTRQVAVYITDLSQSSKDFRQVADVRAINTTQYVATMRGLTPYTNYQFAAAMLNDQGEGYYGPLSSTIRTSIGLPSPPVLSQSQPGSTVIRLVWGEPAQPGGPLLAYIIYYRSSGTGPWVEQRIGTDVTTYDLRGLTPGRAYQVAMAAETAAGIGERSQAQENLMDGASDSSSNASLSDGALVGVTVSVVVMIVVLMAFFLIRGRRHRDYNDQLEMQLQTMKMGVEELTTKVRDMFSKEFAETIGGDAEATELEFSKLEIDRNQLHMGRELGKGAFGVVRMATMRLEDGRDRTVAVKTLLDGVIQSELTKFLVEARLMSLLQHESLLELLAVCTVDTPFYIVTEFMPKGDLKQYLRDCRPNNEDRKDEITSEHLMSMTLQIGAAMRYLEAKKVIHRDLAARNVLVSDDNVVKLADFGMSRNIVEADYYKKQSDDRVPVKWMAPESVNDRVYTNYSDVWSFGVLSWEVFTYAKAPYAEYTAMEAVAAVAAGYRLPHPDDCSDEMYSLMLRCWMYTPTDRFTFAELYEELSFLAQTGRLMSPMSPSSIDKMVAGHEAAEIDEDGYVDDPTSSGFSSAQPHDVATLSSSSAAVPPARPPKAREAAPHVTGGLAQPLPQSKANPQYIHILSSNGPQHGQGPRPAWGVPSSSYSPLPSSLPQQRSGQYHQLPGQYHPLPQQQQYPVQYPGQYHNGPGQYQRLPQQAAFPGPRMVPRQPAAPAVPLPPRGQPPRTQSFEESGFDTA